MIRELISISNRKRDKYPDGIPITTKGKKFILKTEPHQGFVRYLFLIGLGTNNEPHPFPSVRFFINCVLIWN